MLETVTPNRFDIKNLIIEAPSHIGEVFDPRLDITSQDIEGARSYLNWMALPKPPDGDDISFMLNTSDYFAAASHLTILGLGYLVKPRPDQIESAFRIGQKTI
jgi:hypothetical protein